jgi:hypothetical protein|tara:strand:+ start:8789 stop:10039 length:1251 start_codon:yes stop_codon:yes gene_type:complete
MINLDYSLWEKFCGNFFTICFNWGKSASLLNTNDVLQNKNLYFLKYRVKGNFQSEILPQNFLSDGIQLFFNFFQNLLEINILLLVSSFFTIIFLVLFFNLFKILFKSNWNNKKLIFFLVCVFLIINLYVFKQQASSLIYFVSSIMPILIIGSINKNNKLDNLIFLTISSLFIIIIFGSMRNSSYLGYVIFLLIIGIKLNYKLFPKIMFCALTIASIFSLFIISNKVNEIKNINIKKVNQQYPFEHTVTGNNFYFTFYTGLGFLNNNYVPGGFLDAHLYSVDMLPEKYKTEKNKINVDKYISNKVGVTKDHMNFIKKKTFEIIINNPKLIIETIFAKIGVLLIYLLVIINYFIYEFFKNKKIKNNYKLALIGNLIAYSIFPIISIPILNYSSGFIGACFSILIIVISKFDFKKNFNF